MAIQVVKVDPTTGNLVRTPAVVEASEVQTAPTISAIPRAGTDGKIDVGWIPALAAATLTVQEQDGTPSIDHVVQLRLPNGSLTDLGSGVVQVDLATSGGSSGMTNPMITAGDLIIGGTPDVTNVAINGNGTTLSVANLYSGPVGAIDNNDSTGTHLAANTPGYFLITLPTVQHIVAFRVLQWTTAMGGGSGNRRTSYTIQSSIDLATWTDRYAFSDDAPEDTGVLPLSSSVSAQYWRLICVGEGQSWQVNTFALYTGTAPGTPTRLAPSSDGRALVLSGGLPVWAGGFSGTIPLAALTSGGTAGSLTIADGRITAAVAPT